MSDISSASNGKANGAYVAPAFNRSEQIKRNIKELEYWQEMGFSQSLVPLNEGGKIPYHKEWQNLQYSEADLRKAVESYKNIGLRLPRKFISIDVEGSAVGDQLVDLIQALHPGVPYRTRPGSNSTAFLFAVDDESPSPAWSFWRPDGVAGESEKLIEVLAGGQLHILGHRSDKENARLQWTNLCPADDLPVIDADDLIQLRHQIADLLTSENIEVKLSAGSRNGAGGSQSDPNWKPERISLPLLKRALAAIPRDAAFGERDRRNMMMHAIYGASDGSDEGRELWLDWDGQKHPEAVPNDPAKAAAQWDRLDNVRAGAGFICQELERLEEYELLEEIQLELAQGTFPPQPEAEKIEWRASCGAKPLRRQVEEAALFPTKYLPQVIADAVTAAAWITQSPEAMAASSALATLSLAGQCLADVMHPSLHFPIPTSLMLLTIADSGDRKSSVDKILTQAIRTREIEMRGLYDLEIAQYERDDAAYKAKVAAVKRNAKNLTKEQIAAAIDGVGHKPEPPLDRTLTVSTPTVEGLAAQFMRGQPGLGLFNDEGGSLTGGYSMNRDNRTATFSVISKLWDGGGFNDVRADAEKSRFITGKRLAAHVMMTPTVATNLLSDIVAREQGFLARFLTTAPSTQRGGRMIRRSDDPAAQAEIAAEEAKHNAAIARYNERIAAMMAVDPILRHETRNVLAPRALTIADDAMRLWGSIADYFEMRIGTHGEYAHIPGAAAKALENTMRLAGLFALFSDENATEISRRDLDAAGRIIQFYVSDYARICDASADPRDVVEAEKLLHWLQDVWEEDLIDLTTIYQCGPHSVRTARVAKSLVQQLEDHGWLIPETGKDLMVRGKKVKKAWRIMSDYAKASDGADSGGAGEAEQLLHWMRDVWKEGLIDLVSIYQYGPHSVRKARIAKHLVKILEAGGVVIPETGNDLKVRGKTVKKAWRII